MSETPSKRRKTSPTTSIPINTPSLQSQQTQAPAFASPTRASISRQDAQLTSRGRSPGKSLNEPVSRGKNLNELFGKALGDKTPSLEGNGVEGAKNLRTIGGNFSAKPRRISTSPTKLTRKDKGPAGPIMDLEGVANPFQRRGLRRSPVGSQAQSTRQEPEPEIEDVNPFQRRGLRRSPIASNLLAAPEPPDEVEQSMEQFTTTPPGPPPAQAIHELPVLEASIKKASAKRRTRTSAQDERDQAVELTASLNTNEPKAGAATPSSQPVRETPTQEIQQAVTTPSIVVERTEPQMSVNPKELSTKPSISKSKHVSQASKSPTPQIGLTSEKRNPPPVITEPDLPPTPTQRGLADPVVTTPPSGIHNTPSRRARARRSKAAKSSPLKPRDERPNDSQLEKPPAAELIENPKVDARPPTSKPKEVSQRRRSARFLIPEDPHLQKKKERDALLKEIQHLQADIKLANQETERLRLHHQTPGKNETKPLHNNKESEELMAMLLRSTVRSSQKTAVASAEKSIFSSISSFLPFRSRRKRNAIPSTTVQQVLDKPLPSLLPLPQSDPLPFLKAFSPMNLNSTIAMLPPSPSSPNSTSEESTDSRLQEHTISASHPSSLFHARLSLVVETSSHTIRSLLVQKIDPAAEYELGSFLRAKAESKEISVIGWAMGRWTEVAITRARFWCAVEDELRDVEARKKTVEAVLKTRNRKRKRTRNEDEEEEATDENDDEVTTSKDLKEKKWAKRDLIPQMGRTSFEITSNPYHDASDEQTPSKDGSLILRLDWKMEFDWTGEVESHITAAVDVPSSWQSSDERKSLATIPSTFQRLVKREGPLEAVRSLAVLLFSESS